MADMAAEDCISRSKKGEVFSLEHPGKPKWKGARLSVSPQGRNVNILRASVRPSQQVSASKRFPEDWKFLEVFNPFLSSAVALEFGEFPLPPIASSE